MKFALLAASALAMTAVPAFAQDTMSTTTPPPAEAPAQDMSTQQTPPPATDSGQMTTTQDPAMAAPAQDQAMPMQQPQTTTGTMTQGGYAPSSAPMMGTPAPGGQVVFRPSTPVAQAFPPPPPKDSYPTCTRTLRDGCTNPGAR